MIVNFTQVVVLDWGQDYHTLLTVVQPLCVSVHYLNLCFSTLKL